MDRKLRHAQAVFPQREPRRTTSLRRASSHGRDADLSRELEAEGSRLDALQHQVDELLIITVRKLGLITSERRALTDRQRKILRTAGLL